MDAFAIVNYKTKEILLTKEFSPITNAKKKFQIFIMNIDTIINKSTPSPFLSFSTANFVYYPVKQNGEIILLYIAISDKCTFADHNLLICHTLCIGCNSSNITCICLIKQFVRIWFIVKL